MSRTFHGLELDRFQEEAIDSIDADQSVVVAAPTGCGKTLIAEYAIEKVLKEGGRIFYTGPIKALSNQKFRDFTNRYGTNNVGIVTGDVRMNTHAPIVVMTTEIFRNSLFDGAGGSLDSVQCVIFDEVHYLGDAERGTVWEESIIFAPPHIRFVCLSATVPNAREFTDWISHVRAEKVNYVHEPNRPVPLKHYMFMGNQIFDAPKLKGMLQKANQFKRGNKNKYDKERDARGMVKWLKDNRKLPALYFCFNRRECEVKAHAFQNFKFLKPQDSERVLTQFELLLRRLQIDPDIPTANEMRDLVERGIAYHHAGLLPAMKDVVEQLFAMGLIKLLICTETFAMGVNMPAASVAFDALKKFNGVSIDWLKVKEYTQMAGRAGRRGMDKSGTVVSLVEPRDCDMRALKHIVSSKVEPLESSFNLSYGSLCNLIDRVGAHNLHTTLEKSFVLYSQKKRKKGMGRLKETLDARLRVLEEFDYTKGSELTDKGRMAGKINGFEVMGCEWYDTGTLGRLSNESIAVLFMSAIFESRRGDWYKRPNWDRIHDEYMEVAQRVYEFREHELSLGLQPLRELDFKFTQAVLHWYRGGEFVDFDHYTSAKEGDIVRNFLLCCQFLRQMAHVVPDPVLADRFKEVRNTLFRGVMDAEAQLRLSCEPDAEEEEDEEKKKANSPFSPENIEKSDEN